MLFAVSVTTKLHGHAVGLALDAARLDHAADAEHAVLRRFVRGDLGRREEEDEVLLERVSTSAAAIAQRREAAEDHEPALVTWFHRAPPSARRGAPGVLERRGRLRRSAATSTAIRANVTRYEPQT